MDCRRSFPPLTEDFCGGKRFTTTIQHFLRKLYLQQLAPDFLSTKVLSRFAEESFVVATQLNILGKVYYNNNSLWIFVEKSFTMSTRSTFCRRRSTQDFLRKKVFITTTQVCGRKFRHGSSPKIFEEESFVTTTHPRF